MKKVIFIFGGLIHFLNLNIAFSQDAPLLVKIVNHNSVVRYDHSTGSESILYSHANIFIQNLTVSSTGRFLAFIEATEGIISGNEYKVLPKNTLRILDPSGTVIHTVEKDVRRYAWNPAENKMAYITGKYYEGGIGFLPEAAYYFSLETKEIIKIDGVNSPYELAWKTETNSFYIKTLYPLNNSRVFRYDIDNRKLVPTNYFDLHFSPDGDYYAHFPDESDAKFRLYRASTNQEINRELFLPLGSPVNWVFVSGHLFLFEKKEMEITKAPSKGPLAAVKERNIKSIKYSFFDPGEGIVVKELENMTLGEWISQSAVLPFVKDGKMSFYTFTNLLKH